MQLKPLEDVCHSFVAGAVEVWSKCISATSQCHRGDPGSSYQGPCTTEASIPHGMKYKPMEDLCRSFGAGAVEVVSKFICAALQCRLEGPRSSDQCPCTPEACMTRGM